MKVAATMTRGEYKKQTWCRKKKVENRNGSEMLQGDKPGNEWLKYHLCVRIGDIHYKVVKS